MECIEKIIKKMSCTLVDIKISNEGNAVMLLDELRNISYATTTSTDAFPSGTYLLKFCIVGDAKGTFQLVGRSGFYSSPCIFCKYTPKEWKSKHIIRSGECISTCVQKDK